MGLLSKKPAAPSYTSSTPTRESTPESSDGIDLNSFQRKLAARFPFFDDAKTTIDDGVCNVVNSSVNIKDVSDDVMIKASLYEAGVVILYFILDKMDDSLGAYKALNKYNDDSAWFSAYRQENGYLAVTYREFVMEDTDDAVQAVADGLDRFIRDSNEEKIRTLLTYCHR